MEVICKPRGSGKTSELIMESARMNVKILTGYTKNRIIEMAKEMGVMIPEPIELKQLDLNNNEPVLVDDVDYVLMKLLNRDVLTVTVTPDSMCARKTEKEYINRRGKDNFQINSILLKQF